MECTTRDFPGLVECYARSGSCRWAGAAVREWWPMLLRAAQDLASIQAGCSQGPYGMDGLSGLSPTAAQSSACTPSHGIRLSSGFSSRGSGECFPRSAGLRHRATNVTYGYPRQRIPMLRRMINGPAPDPYSSVRLVVVSHRPGGARVPGACRPLGQCHGGSPGQCHRQLWRMANGSVVHSM